MGHDDRCDERMQALETRLRTLEDESEIRRVIGSYGPLVDSGDADGASQLWDPEGIYDVDDLLMDGQHAIAAMVMSPQHRSFISGGCAHVIGPPHIRLEGDDAVAVCHSLLVLHKNGRFVVQRATANHWKLHRGDAGWRVTTRTSRLLDGRGESPDLFRRGLRPDES